MVFWEIFWRIYGAVFMIIGTFALWKAVQLYRLASRSVPDEQPTLRRLSKTWLRDAVMLFSAGFSTYVLAPYTATLFAKPVISLASIGILLYLIFRCCLRKWVGCNHGMGVQSTDLSTQHPKSDRDGS